MIFLRRRFAWSNAVAGLIAVAGCAGLPMLQLSVSEATIAARKRSSVATAATSISAEECLKRRRVDDWNVRNRTPLKTSAGPVQSTKVQIPSCLTDAVTAAHFFRALRNDHQDQRGRREPLQTHAPTVASESIQRLQPTENTI